MATNKSQCDHCVFKIIEDQSSIESAENIEEKYTLLRNLKNAPKKSRIISVSNTGENDKTETCAANSPNWPQQEKINTYCQDFIENNISLADALQIKEMRKVPNSKWDDRPTGKIGLSIFAIVVAGLAGYLIKHFLKLN